MTAVVTACYHCGETCSNTDITINEKTFCCEGCKLVYELLNGHQLCDYYRLNDRPGIPQRVPVRKDKFAFLEEEKIIQQLIQFRDETRTHITFYIPNIHCSSCLWLLENLHRLHGGVQRVTVNFARKEAQVVFLHEQLSLRGVVELLTTIGYEPYISLQDLQGNKKSISRQLIYQLGVAGFCFGNIMLLSFPEYFSGDGGMDTGLFRWLNLALSLPVFFYSAQVFFRSGWSGIRHGFLNIDVPIALAILVTFVRSVSDVLTDSGAGYFDSMTGIVFFMLAGRVLQEKTYQGLSFDRDYTAYFPIAVTVVSDEKETQVALPEIRSGQTLLIHHQELIPADGILLKGEALIDYSFVTGEATPVRRTVGEIIYAGGYQLSGNITLLTIKEVAQSYLTSLWNRRELKEEKAKAPSFIHLLGRYFAWLVLSLAAITAAWWAVHDPSRIWPAVTAILIVACPCGLLLAASFTNGFILRILSGQRLYLRNAAAIERLADTDHIVFDKTGTLSSRNSAEVCFYGQPLSAAERRDIAALAAQSSHPLSKMVYAYCGTGTSPVQHFVSQPGKGISGQVHNNLIRLGNADFTGAGNDDSPDGSAVYLNMNGRVYGRFSVRNAYRKGIQGLFRRLRGRFALSLLSGDNDREAGAFRELMGPSATLRFEQMPQDKLDYILQLQQQGQRVLMVGDGLNDAGALLQSHTGISVTENSNNFTPASDGILEAAQLPLLPDLIQTCRNGKHIILTSFIISLIYNITGLFFAVQGTLSPLVAAILMPASSISIILLTWGMSTAAGKRLQQKASQTADDKDQLPG
ncbi:heavy metal translocating P-type ATPase metal-binding domain-containing protein [uncultured Chitinophaga sp.]|jgi:ATPase, P-type (transporting), HAD superfamily, subfamily IC|uniref:heavy metal translocating P-type ATPase n=1 Tax=uncultured Chitinophaga sp. TaxID=339340 RepID=UPI0026349284|nr:heavy metal translocating P-type ATPase metal-binding domain-containing protein [uncultured Chitinophaga sp.]